MNKIRPYQREACDPDIVQAIRVALPTMPQEFSYHDAVSAALRVKGAVDTFSVLNSLDHLTMASEIVELTAGTQCAGQHRRYRNPQATRTDRVYATREDWLTARASFLGASETAGILGCGYADQSPITIWASKVHGIADELEMKRLRIGVLMEPVLRELFTDETGIVLDDLPPWTVYRHAQFPWMGATLDGIAGGIPVELKNVGPYNRKDWEGEPPLKFLVQVQHQIAVCDAPYGYLFGLIGGNEPVVTRVERHDRLIAIILQKLAEFWGYVERRELPPVDDSEATAKALSRLWSEEPGKSVLLPYEALEWAERFEAAKEAKKAAEAEETKYGNLLKAAIADAECGDVPGFGRYSYKTQTRRAYTVEEATFRVLRRVKAKGGK